MFYRLFNMKDTEKKSSNGFFFGSKRTTNTLRLTLSLILYLFLGALNYASALPPVNSDIEKKWAKGEVLVKLKNNSPHLNGAPPVTSLAPSPTTTISLDWEPLIDHSVQQRFGTQSPQSSTSGVGDALKQIYRVRFDANSAKVEDIVAQLKSQTNIDWVEPNYIYTIYATPDDPKFAEQLHLNFIQAPQAWDLITNASTVKVGIIDTGIDLQHPDLVPNIWTNPDEIPDDNIDNDGNGYVDDVNGWDFVTATPTNSFITPDEDGAPADNNPDDIQGHGTHVSGIVGARGNNGIGVSGVAWNVSLVPLRAGFKAFLGGSLLLSDWTEALVYAADNGVDIVNMSFGGPGINPRTAAEAIQYAHENNVLLVAAAGNSSTDELHSPANNAHVIAVASTDEQSGVISPFSNYGTWVDIAAPGGSILSTVPEVINPNLYDEFSGTSMASPVVVGVAALTLAANPTWTAEQVKAQLLTNTTFTAGQNSKTIGAGVIDAAGAVGSVSTRLAHYISHIDTRESGTATNGNIQPGEAFIVEAGITGSGINPVQVTAELSTEDPYISIQSAQQSFAPSYLNTTQTAQWNVTVASGVPENHVAELNLTTASPDANDSNTFTIELNRRWQTTPDIVPSGPLYQGRTNGGQHLVVTQDFTSSGDRLNFSVRKATGAWSRDLPITSGSNPEKVVIAEGADGLLHIAYREWGSVNERFSLELGSFDAAGTRWDTHFFPRAFSVEKNQRDTNIALAATTDGVVHTAYFHYENDETRVFYSLYPGSVGPFMVAPITPDLLFDDVQGEVTLQAWLFARTDGQLDLIVRATSNAGPTPQTKEFKLVGRDDTWSSPQIITANTDASVPFLYEGTIYRTYINANNTISLDRLDTSGWVFDRELMLNPTASNIFSKDLIDLQLTGNGFLIGARPTLADDITIYFQHDGVLETRAFSPETAAGFGDFDVFISPDDQPNLVAVDDTQTNHFGEFDIDPARFPNKPVVTDGGVSTYSHILEFDWVVPSDAVSTEISLGTAPYLQDVMPWAEASGTSLKLDNRILIPLTHQQKYYLNVRTTIANGLSRIGVSDGITFLKEASTCFDGVLNGLESDVDCGGTCGACMNFNVCHANFDCVSDYCDIGLCAPAPIVMELEDFLTTGGPKGFNTGPYQSNGAGGFEYGVLYPDGGDWGEYEITVSEQGIYAADFFAVLRRDGTGINVELNGESIIRDLPNYMSGSPVFDRLKDELVLPVGTHSVRVTATSSNDGGFSFDIGDYIRFEYIGKPTTPAEITIEAEDFTNTGGPFAGFQTYTTSAGIGAINFNQLGDWGEYTLEITEPGTYEASVFAATTITSDIAVELLVDGNAYSKAVSSTGSWNEFLPTVVSGAIPLTAGTYTIRMTSTGSSEWQWNADKLVLKRVSN